MRPIRFLLLLAVFVALPIALTCFSLVHSAKASSEPLSPSFRPRQSRFRALFSFTTPSSLFPPSAVISLTNDNSTFFLARPAAFGPSLPSHGLSGQLWVGRGFGEEILLSDEEIRIHGYELGCSDVPGWDEEHRQKIENGAMKAVSARTGRGLVPNSNVPSKPILSKRDQVSIDDESKEASVVDGTDDHLHQPLPDSNPTVNSKPGEPADVSSDKGLTPTHADIESLQESADIAGKIVMLSRGGCGFLEKVKWAQRRGGIGLIVGDNQPGGQLTIMYAKGDTSNVTIPSLFTSYNAAHLLSSLVPPAKKLEDSADKMEASKSNTSGKLKDVGATEKNTNAEPKRNMGKRPKKVKTETSVDPDHGWMQNVLSAVGLSDEDSDTDDSRRPPSSGNIDWVLLKDWDDENLVATSSASPMQYKATAKSTAPASRSTAARGATTTKRIGNDDFVIGVQDWRDTELIAPKPTVVGNSGRPNGKQEKLIQQPSSKSTGKNPVQAGLKGGIITPGSGEYDHQKHASHGKGARGQGRGNHPGDEVLSEDNRSMRDKFRAFFYHTDQRAIVHPKPKDDTTVPSTKQREEGATAEMTAGGAPSENEGLWVTLTPTSVSTSPFFDTLLVLVVSPLVTLTVVYGLLLLRSRIRRRRWRAPKSIVERLPVRTYHTMSAASSTTSSNVSSAHPSATNSPQIRPSSARPRPRSQTTTGIMSATPEKLDSNHRPRRMKRYNGRQIECVVCLEEYIDGESKVMSLPCGHEFHVECITPWLVTRRRTCPICKGDVVRSFAPASGSADATSLDEDSSMLGEQTSDDVQDTVVETVNEDSSAAIPIPTRDNEVPDDDIERGDSVSAPFSGTARAQSMGWRSFLGASINRLSGDTLWRSTPTDDRAR